MSLDRYTAPECFSSIERADRRGWMVKTWVSPISCYSEYAFTKWGARRMAARTLRYHRALLERETKADFEVVQ